MFLSPSSFLSKIDVSLSITEKKFFLIKNRALAGVAQWIEHQPTNQGVAGLIPGQGTCLGQGFGPTSMFFSFSSSFPSSLSINKQTNK